VTARGFTRTLRLVDVGGAHLMLDADEIKQLPPSRRCRR